MAKLQFTTGALVTRSRLPLTNTRSPAQWVPVAHSRLLQSIRTRAALRSSCVIIPLSSLQPPCPLRWQFVSAADSIKSKRTRCSFYWSVKQKMFRTTHKSEEYSKAQAQFSIEEKARKLSRPARVYSASRRTSAKFFDVSFGWQLDVFLNEQQKDQGRSVVSITYFAFSSLKDGIDHKARKSVFPVCLSTIWCTSPLLLSSQNEPWDDIYI
jgi:hypothetical protein